jgi:hypothetical protein
MDAGDCDFLQIKAFSSHRRLGQKCRRHCADNGDGSDLLMDWTQHGGIESFTASALAMQKWQKVLFYNNFAQIHKSTTNGSILSRLTPNN